MIGPIQLPWWVTPLYAVLIYGPVIILLGIGVWLTTKHDSQLAIIGAIFAAIGLVWLHVLIRHHWR
jgi:hypothetical protein